MSFANTRQQGNKKEFSHPKSNQSRGGKKWSNANHSGTRHNAIATPHSNGSHPASSNANVPPSRLVEITDDAEKTKHAHDKMLFLLAAFVGSVVQVTVKNGTKFEGMFYGASTEGDIGVTLKDARKIFDPAQPEKNKVFSPSKHTLVIQGKDVVDICALQIDLVTEAPPPAKDTFKTDVDISRKTEIKERELHKWTPEGHEVHEFMALEEDLNATKHDGSWDQFATNERLFGLKTDFDEEMYTTRLDRSAPDFKDREKKAIQVANEIQRLATTNVHVLEERNAIVADDSGLDEEDRYGAVIRDTETSKLGTAPLKKKTPASRTADTPGRPGAYLPKLPHDSPLRNITVANTLASNGSSTTGRDRLGLAFSSEKKPQPANPPNVTDMFAAYISDEKVKATAMKTEMNKKMKDKRLAELKSFSTVFKLNSPVPDDLLPLLSKGRRSQSQGGKENSSSPETAKQDQNIATKEASPADKNNAASTVGEAKAPVQTTGSSPSEKGKPVTEAAADVKQDKSSTATEAKSAETAKPSKSNFKFNVKAMEFKPNPAAAVFVPGGKASSAESSPFFAGRQLKKGTSSEPLTIAEAFSSPFSKNEDTSPSTVGPTWPFGNKQYRHYFTPSDNGVFPGYGHPGYAYNYPHYRYPPQFIQGMSPIPLQQGGPVPYMSQQFIPSMPMTAAPMQPATAPAVTYSPQMSNVSPHGSPFPQGFPSPQRSPNVPQGALPHQVYPYQGTSHGGPMMMRYPSEGLSPNATTGSAPMMMLQRPVMVEPSAMHYPPQPDTATSSADAQSE